MTARLKQEQPDRGNDGGACQIEKPLERIDSKQVRNGQLFLAREKQWPHGFSRASQEKHRRKAGQRHCINRSEARRTQVSLKDFPAERAQRVARIDGQHGKNQKEWIRMANRLKQLGPAEISKMHHRALPA